ncbi:MAG: hypothetical protein QXW70_00610 [Candidatus Anstonellales archaeon]
MIISTAPLRISLGGGGTDLRSYYSKFGGFVLSAAINKYVYLLVHNRFDGMIKASYAKMEIVDSPNKIEHPIIREALKMTGINNSIEIFSMADIPANSGLGSSSSYTVALLNGLYAFRKKELTPEELAEKACKLEIDILGQPIGKQDQYIAAFGSLCSFEFLPDESVKIQRLNISTSTLEELEKNLCLFYTGIQRTSTDILSEQNSQTAKNDPKVLANLHEIKNIGYALRDSILSGDLDFVGRALALNWEKKRNLSTKISNDRIDKWYDIAISAGAMGGKLLGAGGGGFLLFYCHQQKQPSLKKRMRAAGLREVKFSFSRIGAKLFRNFI